MAEQILAVREKEYSLSKQERLELLCKTRFGRRAVLIEEQRNAFIARYGDPLGEIEPATEKH